MRRWNVSGSWCGRLHYLSSFGQGYLILFTWPKFFCPNRKRLFESYFIWSECKLPIHYGWNKQDDLITNPLWLTVDNGKFVWHLDPQCPTIHWTAYVHLQCRWCRALNVTPRRSSADIVCGALDVNHTHRGLTQRVSTCWQSNRWWHTIIFLI